MPETSYQKLLKEALDWLEDDAERMHIDNLFEKIERNAAGDERPVPEVALNALCNLIDRIIDSLQSGSDYTESYPKYSAENQANRTVEYDECGDPIDSIRSRTSNKLRVLSS